MRTVPDLFKSAVKDNPNRIAVVEDGIGITYATLCSMVQDLSSFLLKRGVVKGERVAILLPNSFEYIVAFFGIASIGAVSVPINTAYKEEEINYFITNSSPRIVITEAKLKTLAEKAARVIGAGVVVIKGVETNWAHSNDGREFSIDWSIDPQDEALYLYSTGSTGKPKRVVRTHFSLIALAENHSQTVGWTENDRILFVVPLSHTYALGNFISSIRVGATLYVLGSFNRNKVIDIIEKESISIFPAVPFMLNVLAESFMQRPRDFSSLKLVISAGSPLSKGVFFKFHKRFGVYPRQLYGSTETGVISINLSEDIENMYYSVGRPVKNVEVKIVREDGALADIDEVGEIAVKSPSMASGYYDLPEETNKAFRNGYYFTGDLGVIDKGGYIFIKGRKKMFINISGNKVNPVEVEDLLLRHPKIKEIVVFGVNDASGNELVKAVIVPKDGMSVKDVVDFCDGKIADYKIPRIIEFKSKIPKSPTGKVLIEHL